MGVTVVTPHIQLCSSLHGKLSLCGSVRKLTYIHTQTHRVFSEAEKTTPINTPYNTCEIFQEHRLPPPLVTLTQVSPSSANTHTHGPQEFGQWNIFSCFGSLIQQNGIKIMKTIQISQQVQSSQIPAGVWIVQFLCFGSKQTNSDPQHKSESNHSVQQGLVAKD